MVPKVKRGTSEATSCPTVASIRPRITIIAARAGGPSPAKADTDTNASTPTAK